MANPAIQTAYSGEVLDHLLIKAATGNQLFEQGLIHLETNIGNKFYIPRLQLSKLLQKRVEMPKSENSKGTFTIDERVLAPQDFMAYAEFNPRSFEKFWKKYQPQGNLVFSELTPEVQKAFLDAILTQIGSELNFHFIQGEAGDGDNHFFNGILTRIFADPKVNKATCSKTSMIARLRAVWEKTPEEVRNNPKFTFLMSQADFDKYDDELTDLHHKGADPTSTNVPRFKGKRIAALNDWPSDVIVGTIASIDADSNLYAGCNLADDFECLQIDKVQNNGELYFIKVLMKADTQVAWGELVTLLDTREVTLTVSPTAVPEFTKAGGEKEVAVTASTGNYTVAVDGGADWFTAVKGDDGKITVTAQANTGDARNGSFTVTLGSKTQKVTVSQAKGN